MKEFYEYTLDDKKIVFHKTSTILVQIGKRKSSYKTQASFRASEFSRAVMYYNMINTGNGYKKRLICDSLNEPLLARQFS